jgi:hypothetical protein
MSPRPPAQGLVGTAAMHVARERYRRSSVGGDAKAARAAATESPFTSSRTVRCYVDGPATGDSGYSASTRHPRAPSTSCPGGAVAPPDRSLAQSRKHLLGAEPLADGSAHWQHSQASRRHLRPQSMRERSSPLPVHGPSSYNEALQPSPGGRASSHGMADELAHAVSLAVLFVPIPTNLYLIHF